MSKEKPDVVEGQVTRCSNCGSTDRTRYTTKNEQEYSGTDPAGKPFTHIIKRRTSCADCGQHRVDRTYENRPKKSGRKFSTPSTTEPGS